MPSSAAKKFKPTDISSTPPAIFTHATSLNGGILAESTVYAEAEWQPYLPSLATSVAFPSEVFTTVGSVHNLVRLFRHSNSNNNG